VNDAAEIDVTPEENVPLSDNPKDAAFLKCYFETGSVKQAAIDSKLTTKKNKDGTIDGIRAAIVGAQALKRLQPKIAEMMNAVGLGPLEILAKLTEGLDAMEHYQVKTGQYTTEVISKEDFRSRAKYVEMALKCHGLLLNSSPVMKLQGPDKPIEHQHRHSLEGKSTDELNRILEEENRARKTVRAIR
jgi:hypothetical protein